MYKEWHRDVDYRMINVAGIIQNKRADDLNNRLMRWRNYKRTSILRNFRFSLFNLKYLRSRSPLRYLFFGETKAQ